MNRFDGIIEFKALSKGTSFRLSSLCQQTLTNVFLTTTFIVLTEQVKEKLSLTSVMIKWEHAPLRRTIQDYIEDAITDYLP